MTAVGVVKRESVWMGERDEVAKRGGDVFDEREA